MNAVAEQSTQEIAYIDEATGQVLTAEQIQQSKSMQLQKLYTFFSSMRNRWVSHRAGQGVESRWRKAGKLFHGDSDIAVATDLKSTLTDGPAKPNVPQALRSKVVINIVRPKVEQAEARLCDILFPVDDRNWGIRPTPLPELANYIGNQTPTVDPVTKQPTGRTGDEEAQLIMKAAKQSAERMEKSIDDNLTECAFNGECRKTISDGVRLGTGVIKGPFPKKRNRKLWQQEGNVSRITLDQKISPASARVDPWNVWFDPGCGEDHQNGRGVFEKRPVTRKDLRALIGIPGYDAAAIREVLKTQPQRVSVVEGRISNAVQIEDESYELWEYHGEVEPEELSYLGERVGDNLDECDHAVIIMVNDVIIGCTPSWVSDKTVPYDVWNWRQADGSPYGYGLAEELEHQQSVVNSSWRQVMDNGRNSLGGQIVMRKGDVTPANGQWEITPMKVWHANSKTVQVEHVFKVFEFASHADELLKIAQAAMAFSDLESGIPQLMQGEKGSAPETLGGMVMLYNNANAVLRQRVKLWDDQITRPHLGRYYDFKMANDPDGTIKGDYEVDARGSSTLVERDIQNQAMLNLANIVSNPRYAPHLKEREEIKTILKAFKVNPDDIMKTEQEVEKEQANAQPQQDPRIVSAQMNLEAKKMDISDRQEQRQYDAQRNQTDDQFRNLQLAYNKDREQAEFTIAQTGSAITRDIALLRESNALTISREANAARTRLGLINVEKDRQIFNAEAALRLRTGQGI